MSGLLSYFRDEAAGDARNFLQGASNSAASTISAPVDGMAWLMRKMGIPIPAAPFGGSDWMAQRGLTAAAPGKAGLLGETAGMVLPIAAQAKAPQIAKGLLTVEANAAKPSPAVWDQRGAIVWHGSPHQFNKFDSSKIGSGEGAQVYGHGLYLAEQPAVARSYAAMGLPDTSSLSHEAQKAFNKAAKKIIKATGKTGSVTSQYTANLAAKSAKSDEVIQELWRYADEPQKRLGHVYKVDLPDEAIAKMIDWDNPIPEPMRQQLSQKAAEKFGSGLSGTSGEKLLKTLEWEFRRLGSKRPAADAAEFLRSSGVPGVRYLDGGSRSVGKGSSNYVVFPGEEGLLSILEHNRVAQ